jgi:hypothetical protein
MTQKYQLSQTKGIPKAKSRRSLKPKYVDEKARMSKQLAL